MDLNGWYRERSEEVASACFRLHQIHSLSSKRFVSGDKLEQTKIASHNLEADICEARFTSSMNGHRHLARRCFCMVSHHFIVWPSG
jgi:hypothetical protein